MAYEILFPAPRAFVLASCEDGPLAPDEVRGRTICTLVSQGTELAWANGDSFPIRPGYAAVFEVTAIGAAVTGIPQGALRFAMGPHRSVQTHKAALTLPLPAGLSPETAVVARLMGVSMTTLMTTRARAGDAVLVAGAGPVGFLAAHLFRIAGYPVTLVDPDATRRASATQSGLADVRAEMPLDDPALRGRIALLVDCSGHEAAVLDGCRMLRRGGEAVLVGVPWRKLTEISAHDLLDAVFNGLITLRSGWEWEVPLLGRDFQWEELLDGYNNAPHSVFGGFARALNWLAEGRVPLDGLIHRQSPRDPAAFYADIASRRIAKPFIVLDWTALQQEENP